MLKAFSINDDDVNDVVHDNGNEKATMIATRTTAVTVLLADVLSPPLLSLRVPFLLFPSPIAFASP